MNDAQTWTVIGVLTAMIAAMITLVLTTNARTLRSIGDIIDARFGGLDGRFAAVDARFAAVDAKIDSLREVMDARFASVERRLDGLDRDVAMLVDRLPKG